LARLVDVYDYAVWRADRRLGNVLEELRRRGRFKAGLRLVITSDHGEFLGEHGLLSHGLHTYEANQRVPLVFYQNGGAAIRSLPDHISALAVHALVSDGVLPDPPLPIEAIATPGAIQAACSQGRYGTHVVASSWQGSEKVSSVNGQLQWIDLAADSAESFPRAADDHPLAARVRELADRADRSYRDRSTQGEAEQNQEVTEALRALGYIE